MASSPYLTLNSTFPAATFEQLGHILQLMAKEVGTEAVVLTEAVLLPVQEVPKQLEQFIVVVSESFSALLVGNATASPSLLNISLTFAPDAIALFLTQLGELLADQPHAQVALANYSQVLQLNDPALQSHFTLLLLSILVPKENPQVEPTKYPHVFVCQPVADALRQQIAQEQLLYEVTTQIRQSTDLVLILSTAVAQVREFLQLDRLVIYQFEETKDTSSATELATASESPADWQQHSGCIIYEVRSTEVVPSVLNYKEEDCFLKRSPCWEKYRQGFILAIDDVETAYILSPCLLKFLRQTQIRAKLVAPIVVEEKLWGLLIAHQCLEPRHWLNNEKNLLRQVAEQLAIAIHQTELMRSLTEEKQTLEQRVIERTQALQEALIAAQAANRAKSEFLARMSHELRSPLTSIIGLSSTLLRWQIGELNQRQRHYLQIIYDSGKNLLAIINDILELSQLQAGRTALNMTEFSLQKLAAASLETFAETAQQQDIKLNLELNLQPQEFQLQADCQRIEQVLRNILSNAIKFTPSGGQVILRVWLEDHTAVLQVEDTGIGIPEQQLPLLFEQFQQLDSPHCRLYEGIGLGLALTKQLVELHQGRIEVESTVGVGSTFTVWLPCRTSVNG